MPHILVVEDDERMARSLVRGLTRKSYTVSVINHGVDARLFDISTVDLVLLDWGLPVFDGISVLDYWRKEKKYTTPVLMFTARNEVMDTVTGLDHGADDYMSKFFEWHELYARISALLRRAGYQSNTHICIAGITWDKEKKVFIKNDAIIPFTATEYKMMVYFFEHADVIISPSQLLHSIYTDDNEPDSNVVSRHIKEIRKKISYDSIQTIRGMGYRLTSTPNR